jgi:transcriptional regulator with PAS, ATPase and Fis domain
MPLMPELCEPQEDRSPALIAVSAVFESFGRALVCLDSSFRIVHASAHLRRLLGDGIVDGMLGQTVDVLLGEELFAPGGALRHVLEHGERREGWRATLRLPDGSSHVFSISAAPLVHDRFGICDPSVAYVIIIRASEGDQMLGTSAPLVFSGMIARSTAMSHLFQLVQNLQTSDSTILLTGESGTGKEVLARAIHANSSRGAGRFVAVNSAAMPAELLESELFGHVRGAFTGAVRDRMGRVELAAGGTLFLDEIGDMPLQLQVKLLRFLQEKTFERIGESVSRKADVRVIAATHVDLRRAIVEGRFREDLYYRLRVVPIEIPPLRARREDIEPLAQYLLARVTARHGRSVRFSPDALRALLRYSWPGNVRELENAIEYAVAVGRGQTIMPEDLPIEVTELSGVYLSPAHSAYDLPADRPEARERLRVGVPSHARDGERDFLRAILDQHQWRREEAARSLGISRTTLWRRMREAGLI